MPCTCRPLVARVGLQENSYSPAQLRDAIIGNLTRKISDYSCEEEVNGNEGVSEVLYIPVNLCDPLLETNRHNVLEGH